MVFYNLACSYSLNQDFDKAGGSPGTGARFGLPRFPLARLVTLTCGNSEAAGLPAHRGQDPEDESPGHLSVMNVLLDGRRQPFRTVTFDAEIKQRPAH